MLEGDHYEFFINSLKPIDDDHEDTIKGYSAIKLGDNEKFDKVKKDIRKTIDQYQKQAAAINSFLSSIGV